MGHPYKLLELFRHRSFSVAPKVFPPSYVHQHVSMTWKRNSTFSEPIGNTFAPLRMARLIPCMSLICIVPLLLQTAHAQPPGPSGSTLVHNLIHRLYDQRSENHTQFGFIVIGELDNDALPTDVLLRPAYDTTVFPLVNKSVPVFPSARIDRENYIVARPDEGLHAEDHLLLALDELMEDRPRLAHHHFILLYSWIFPCQYCVEEILTAAERYNQNQWFVAYTTDGVRISGRTRSEIDDEREQNERRMTQVGIGVIRERCRHLPPPRYVHDELRHRRSADDVETCTNRNTFQVCLALCLDTQVARCCLSGGSITMDAAASAFVNSFTDRCFPSYTKECVSTFVQWYRRTVCSCIAVNAVRRVLKECLPDCMQYPLSNPLETPSPLASVHIITDRSELRQRPEDIPIVATCMTYTDPEFRSYRVLRRDRRATCMTSLECGYHNYWTEECRHSFTRRRLGFRRGSGQNG